MVVYVDESKECPLRTMIVKVNYYVTCPENRLPWVRVSALAITLAVELTVLLPFLLPAMPRILLGRPTATPAQEMFLSVCSPLL